jgi:beta-lactamase class A
MQRTQQHVKTAAVISLVIVFATGFYLGDYNESQRLHKFIKSFKPIRQVSTDNKYIRPLIGVESPEATEFGFYVDLKDDVKDIIKKAQKKGVISVSVYFRDLNTSLWFGIEKDEKFYPASLLKLPFAFAAYKGIEDSEMQKNRYYTYTDEIASINRNRPSAEPSKLVIGKQYKLDELVRIMIEQSDNGARDMLNIFTPQESVQNVFATLGVNLPKPAVDYLMTTEKYAMFLRMLYSSSYLNNKNSNDLLTLLTETDFTSGITNKLPPGLEVAHKWGVINLPPDQNGVAVQQLHDCGIIYRANNPYVICIMTKGLDQSVLAQVIADISKIVYDYVEKDR